MSGKLRQAIGQTRRHIKDALESYNQIKEKLEIAPEQFTDDELDENFEAITANFEKLRKHVERLENLDKQWSELIQNDPKEAQERTKFITDYGDYNLTLKEGRNAVDHIRRRIVRLQLAVKDRFEINDVHDAAPSEGTLKNIPPNEEIFSTPMRSPIPPELISPFQTGATTPVTFEPSLPTQIHPQITTPVPDWANLLYLPSVAIPKFNGDPSCWAEFWDIFSAMIDQRPIEPCIKLFHLKSNLEGDARRCLAHLGSSSLDYPIAVQTLKDLFGDPMFVTHRLRSELLKIQLDTRNAISLYKGWSHMNQIYSQLTSMGDQADTTLLGQVVESKLPRYILQRVYKNSQKILTGKEMLTAVGNILRKEANLDRMVADNRYDTSKHQNRYEPPKHQNRYDASKPQKQNHFRKHNDQIFTHFSNNQESKMCDLCDEKNTHNTYQCPKFKEPRERARQVKFKGLCYNCMKKHNLNECPSKNVCHHCQKRHHSSICFKNDIVEPNQQQRVTFQKSAQDKSSKNNQRGKTGTKFSTKKATTNAIINEDDEIQEEYTHSSHDLPNKETVLLKTALVKVSSIKHNSPTEQVTLFMDGGSTKSYISQSLANKLKLTPITSEKLSINIFGNQQMQCNTHSYYVKICTQQKEKPVIIRVTALPQLTSEVQQAKLEDILSTKLTTIKVKPDLLIGRDQKDKLPVPEITKVLPSGFKMDKSSIGTFIHGTGQALTSKFFPSNTFHSYQSGDENEKEEITQNQNSFGSIKLILGAMWSGKTTRLIEEINKIPDESKILVIKHKSDTRYTDQPYIVTHDQITHKCIATDSLTSIWTQILEHEYIIVDEAHFFKEAPDVLNDAAQLGKTIIATAIHSNSQQSAIIHVAELIAKADELIMLKGNCKLCGRNTPFTIRHVPPPTNQEDMSEWIGGEDKYTTLCRQCITIVTFETIQENTQFHHTYMANIETIEENEIDEQSDKPLTKENHQNLHKLLTRFWCIEHLGITDDIERKDDEVALESFLKTIKRKEDGRYVCSWPWKHSPDKLQDNFAKCIGRLRSNLRKLKKDKKLLEHYDSIFKEQIKQDILEEVKFGQKDGPIRYIPHQAVIRLDKPTTPIRIVLDASATTPDNRSLNEMLLRGMVLLPNLEGMLHRFRVTPIPLMGDIQKAFLQIELETSQRDCTRILWVRDLNLPAEGSNLIVYRHKRLPFGFISSPFILAATIDHHLQNYPHPLAQQMRNNSYVDNLLLEANTVEEAKNAYFESRRIFKDAQMVLHEFQSSNPEVLSFLAEEGVSVPETVKVLGIPWSIKNDTITMFLPKKTKITENPTKREVLKFLASFYDPLGICTPILTQAKLFLQHLWSTVERWDDQLNEEDKKKWIQIRTELLNFTPPSIPRQICPTRPVISSQLHIFCDASTESFAAVAYLRTETPTSIEVSFMFGKSRIRPLKGPTVPRMELLSILIGSRMGKKIENELNDLRPSQIFIHSDSTIALSWVHSRKLLPIFIKNRVTEIWKNVPKAKIRYTPTNQNAADCATRPFKPANLEQSLWLKGPEWLKEDMSKWPKQPESLPEEPEAITAVAETTPLPAEPLINFERHSKWHTSINVLIFVLTFLQKTLWSKLKRRTERMDFLNTTFSPKANQSTKFIEAEMIAFRSLQNEIPPNNQTIKNLNLEEDKCHILRCRTRLTHSALHPESANPIYLPTKARGTALYVLHVHKLLSHATPITTLCTLRHRVWIPRARTLIRKVIHNECGCRTLRPFNLPPFPPYPQARITPNAPFTHTSTDYAGPITLQLTKGATTKSWICLFTCLTCRAVHLELVFDMSTFSFLQAFRKFVSRRGVPQQIYSDHGTQYTAASQVLTKAWIESQQVTHYLTTHGIKWNFNTEGAPWSGGIHERLIGMTKTALKKAIGRKIITVPEMMTVLVEIEAILNSRPLTYVSAEESHLIIRPIDCISPGVRLGVPLLEPFINDDETYEPKPNLHTKLIDLWRKQQIVLERFWKIWYDQYVLNLIERTQTTHKQGKGAVKREPIPGEVVIIQDEEVKRGEWRLAKVLTSDKPTRIKLQMAQPPNKILYRSPKNICPLELDPKLEKEEDDTSEANGIEPHKPTKEKRSKRFKALTFSIQIPLLIMLFLPITNAQIAFTDNEVNVQKASEKMCKEHYSTDICTQKAVQGVLLLRELFKSTKNWQEIKKCFNEELQVIDKNQTEQTSQDDCAPWRWNSCSNLQKTGLIIWLTIIILLLPIIFCLSQVIGFLLKTISKIFKCSLKIGQICKRTSSQTKVQNPQRQAKMQKLLRRTGKLMTAVILLTHSLSPSQACSEISHITADSPDCAVDDDTNLENCQILKTIQLSIRPVGEIACIKITSPKNNTEIMGIRTLELQFVCNYKFWYFTRDFSTDVESVHRCREASGSTCFEDWCENIRQDSDCGEFSAAVRKSPGASFCTRSCGCVTCNGCGLCTPSCLFYRIYATPASTFIYEVGTCPTWTLQARLDITYRNSTTTLILTPATQEKAFQATFTLQAATVPQLPILSSPLVVVRSAGQAFISEASRPGQLSSGSVGTLQCPSQEKAKQFDCQFPMEVCKCTPDYYKAKCTCAYENPRSAWKKEETQLPLTSGPVTLHYVGNYTATIEQQTGLLLHVSFTNVSIKITHDEVNCKLSTDGELKGCRACHEGAKANISCSSKKEVTVEVQCKDNSRFQFMCNNLSHEIQINSETENYMTTCFYKCSKKSTGNFTLKGKLTTVTIAPRTIREMGNIWAKPASSVPIDKIFNEILQFFTDLFVDLFKFALNHPFFTIIIIILIIICLLILKTFVYPAVKLYFCPLATLRQHHRPKLRSHRLKRVKPHTH